MPIMSYEEHGRTAMPGGGRTPMRNPGTQATAAAGMAMGGPNHPQGVRMPGQMNTDGTGGPQGSASPDVGQMLMAFAAFLQSRSHLRPSGPPPADPRAAMMGLWGGGYAGGAPPEHAPVTGGTWWHNRNGT